MHGSDIAALAILMGGATAILRPLMRVISLRISGGGDGGDRVQRLEAQLGVTSARLSATEAELVRTTEKVEFLEKLLANPAGSTPPRGPGSSG
jgi:hypothetical protein